MTDAAALLPEPEPTDDEHPPVEVVEQPAVEHDELREPDPSTEQRTTAAVVQWERPTPLVPGHDVPIIPNGGELRDLAAMAVTLAGALAVPKPLQNRPNDVFQVLLTARDLGVAVTTAMREFHVIDGRVTLSPKVKLAMVHERGHREGWKVWPCSPRLEVGELLPCLVCGSTTGCNDTRAAWHATRADHPGSVFSSEFTIDMAQRVPKLTEKANWQSYPQRMLSWRALGYLLDDVFPEVGTGLYSPDELGGMTDEEGNFIDVASSEPLPGTTPPKGHNEPPPPLLIDADPDAHAELARRIAAITAASADARAALLTLWQERGDDERPRLPPLAAVQQRQLSKAKALVQSIEARIRKGEWGDDAKAAHDTASSSDAEHAPESPAASDSAESTETAGEPPNAAQSATAPLSDAGRMAAEREAYEAELSGTEPRHARAAQVAAEQGWSTDVELAQLVVDEVKAMELSDVLTQLDARSAKPKGNPQAQRKQLAELLYAERGGTPSDPPSVPDPGPQHVEQPALDEA